MDAVDRAIAATPRRDFLPKRSRARADFDGPIPIGAGQTNSQPRTVVDMLRLLRVEPGDRVLDVGAGSGWTTALLARLTGPTGTVLGLELRPGLAVWGAANLAGAHCPWATLRPADPRRLGDPDGAPYDRILVSANAVELPQELLDQVADPGRMVLPVGSVMTLVERHGEVRISEHGRYRFVPLVVGGP